MCLINWRNTNMKLVEMPAGLTIHPMRVVDIQNMTFGKGVTKVREVGNAS